MRLLSKIANSIGNKVCDFIGFRIPDDNPNKSDEYKPKKSDNTIQKEKKEKIKKLKKHGNFDLTFDCTCIISSYTTDNEEGKEVTMYNRELNHRRGVLNGYRINDLIKEGKKKADESDQHTGIIKFKLDDGSIVHYDIDNKCIVRFIREAINNGFININIGLLNFIFY